MTDLTHHPPSDRPKRCLLQTCGGVPHHTHHSHPPIYLYPSHTLPPPPMPPKNPQGSPTPSLLSLSSLQLLKHRLFPLLISFPHPLPSRRGPTHALLYKSKTIINTSISK